MARRVDLHELDRAVYLWFVQQRCKGEVYTTVASQIGGYLTATLGYSMLTSLSFLASFRHSNQ